MSFVALAKKDYTLQVALLRIKLRRALIRFRS